MKSMYFLGVASFVVAAALPSQAQDVYFGAHIGVTKLMGDMAKEEYLGSKTTFGIGLHDQIHLQEGHAIVPRVDYVKYSRSNWARIENLDLKATVLQYGVDYNYYFDGKVETGLYLLGGIGLSYLKWEGTYQSANYSATKNTPYIALGGGYSFTRNLGAELRYVHVSYSGLSGATKTLGDWLSKTYSLSGPSLQVALIAQF